MMIPSRHDFLGRDIISAVLQPVLFAAGEDNIYNTDRGV